MSVSASLAVQRAVVAALEATPDIASVVSGVFDGPPPRAAFPYIAIADGVTSDWSTKTERGREVRAALTIWDDGETPARLHALMAAAEPALLLLNGTVDGWRIASVAFQRSLVIRDPAGPWAGLIEIRVRLMAA